MKKHIVHFIAVIVLAFLFTKILPWWSIMIVCIVVGLRIPLKKSAVFFVPFLAIALLWIIQAFLLSNTNDFILAKKIAQLLSLGGNAYLLILVTGIVGGLAGGVAGIFGKQVALLFKP